MSSAPALATPGRKPSPRNGGSRVKHRESNRLELHEAQNRLGYGCPTQTKPEKLSDEHDKKFLVKPMHIQSFSKLKFSNHCTNEGVLQEHGTTGHLSSPLTGTKGTQRYSLQAFLTSVILPLDNQDTRHGPTRR